MLLHTGWGCYAPEGRASCPSERAERGPNPQVTDLILFTRRGLPRLIRGTYGCGPMYSTVITRLPGSSGPYCQKIRHAAGVRFST